MALRDRLMTPLGGDRAMGGHKGYGLAAMVEVLSTLLTGASYAPLRAADAPHYDVGHFFLALNPDAFRDPDETDPDGSGADGFARDLDAFVACLRETPPAAGCEAVLAPGDPEHAVRAVRTRDGIPLPRSLIEAVEGIAAERGAAFLLEDPAG